MDGKWTYLDDKVYYLKDNGEMEIGWVQFGQKWYYLKGDGTTASNTTIDGYNIGFDGTWIQ